jgi:protein-L-isoaspartate(D-aspartate) O-methyltransferase
MVVRMLRLLDVQPGHRVLEIGTGSGYSTALLAELTGPTGSVLSIDFDPEMTERATRLLADAGYGHVVLVAADGREGWAAYAPFDRVIAWAAMTWVPQAWCEQTRTGAVLVVPMRIDRRSWVSKYRRTNESAVVEDERVAGSFIPLTATPFRPWESAAVNARLDFQPGVDRAGTYHHAPTVGERAACARGRGDYRPKCTP